MNCLKHIFITALVSLQLILSAEINPQELQQISKRSEQLTGFIQSRCVTIMKEGKFKELSGVIISKDGHILSSYIRSSENEKFVIYLPGGRRVSATFLDSNIRKGISLLKIDEQANWPAVELADYKIEVNQWGLIGGFGLARSRGQEAQVRLSRILSYKSEEKKHILTFSSCLHSDMGAPYFDMDGRLIGIVSGIGNHQYQTRVTHISAFEDFDGELFEKLKASKIDFYKSFESYSNVLVNEASDDEEENFVQNLKFMQEYLAGSVKEKITAIVQVNSSDSPSILGTVISSDGYILTKASEIGSDLSCNIGETAYPATLYAEDPENDLALLKVEAKGLTYIKWQAHNPGAIVFSPTQNTDELGFGIIGHDTIKLSENFFNVNSPEKNTSLGVALEHKSNSFKIAAFLPDSPLKKAGAVVGDTVISVNGIKTETRQDLVEAISKLSPGLEVSLELKSSDQKIKTLITPLLKAEEKSYPVTDKDYRITDISYRRSGFPSVFIHDGIMEAWQCGGPVFDLKGRAVGINIARHSRTSTLAVSADQIREAINKMMKNSIKF